MKNYLFALLILAPTLLGAQNLISSTLLLTKTKAQLNTQFGVPFIQYGAKLYRITYTTPSINGVLDTASGLVGVPNDATKVFPRLVYQHGTSSSKLDVPSYTVSNGEGTLGGLFAGMGYFTLLPDYLGLGTSRGFHPYVHAASEASAAIDMLRAAQQFVTQLGNVQVNDQLFITGYSQGGHGAMALHRAIEQDPAQEFTTTAAAPMSGPYSIAGVMRDLILSETPYYNPNYLPNTILSYQTVYKNLFVNLEEVFKPNYATLIAPFFSGTKTLGTLNSQLIAQLTSEFGASIPRRMLQDSIINAVVANPNHPFNLALSDNDVYHWAPKAPTRLFYCKADDQVPYRNSIVAGDTMLARGAVDFMIMDVDSTQDHGGCVTPAVIQTLLFFAGLQQVTTSSTSPDVSFDFQFAPNPAREEITLRTIPFDGQLDIIDIQGRIYFSAPVTTNGLSIQVSTLPSGLYMVRLQNGENSVMKKLVVQR
jgi:hypothetical protein